MENALAVKLDNCSPVSSKCSAALGNIFTGRQRKNKRARLFDEGDHPKELMLLLDGWAAREKITDEGDRQIVSLILPGDVFPMVSLLMGETDYSVVTLTSCTIACAPAREVNRVILNDGEVARAFWWMAMVERHILRAWLLNLGRRSAHQRVAHFLCETYCRLHMIGRADDHAFDLPLTQEQIADCQGLTPVHVNRTLQRLRHEGLIEYERTRVRIPDEERLWKVAGFDGSYLNPV